tara:strand:- start:1561 stop:1992 length:432 start_codon:yes stop_codon:yes gene_type:complete
MGTRSKTTIYDEDKTPLVSIYSQFDGYFDGMGEKLQKFLTGRKIVNGIGMDDSEETKCSNGMDCLAAMLVAHLKEKIGGIYICPHDAEESYNYDIHFVEPSRVSLTGWYGAESMGFELYPAPEPDDRPDLTENGRTPDWNIDE